MSSGSFDKLIQIQRKSVSRDNFNQQIDEWITFAQPWASITPLSGREFTARSGEAAQATHIIRCWWIEGVTPANRIEYAGRIFDIQHVSSPQGRERELEMICVERVA